MFAFVVELCLLNQNSFLLTSGEDDHQMVWITIFLRKKNIVKKYSNALEQMSSLTTKNGSKKWLFKSHFMSHISQQKKLKSIFFCTQVPSYD